MRSEFVDERGRRAWPEHTLERVRVFGHVRPLGGHLPGELQVELDAVSMRTPTKRLVWVGGRACQQHRALGQRKRVAVPLQGKELARYAREDGVDPSSLGEEHR